MFSQDFPAGRSLPVDHIEDTIWEPNLVHHLCERVGGQRRDLARFEDNSTTCQKGRDDLENDLVEWIVPRGNSANNSDWFPHDGAESCRIFPFEVRLSVAIVAIIIQQVQYGCDLIDWCHMLYIPGKGLGASQLDREAVDDFVNPGIGLKALVLNT